MHYRIISLQSVLLLFLLLGAVAAESEDNFELVVSPSQSNDGMANLSWSIAGGASVHIEKSPNPDFTRPVTLYRGKDGATVITGLVDGEYHFRGRQELPDGRFSPWSDPVTLVVTHHTLTRAVTFFSIGAVVFLATLLLILFGAKRQGVGD